MKTIVYLRSLLVILLVLSGCTKEPRSEFVPEGYDLAFSDEFETLSLDPDADGSGNWTTWWDGWEVRHLQGNNDKAWKGDASYVGEGEQPIGTVLHEVTGDGNLKLYGMPTPPEILDAVNDFPYVAGMISSRNSFSLTYGYFEVRARFEVSKGMHWALWLLPSDDSWPPEIDMVEVVGHQPDQAHMNAHGTGEQGEFISNRIESAADFHTYGFEWTEEEMIWTLDGQEMKRRSNYIDKPMYILLSPEIGGNWPGLPDSTTVWPTVSEVDYVRIYKGN